MQVFRIAYCQKFLLSKVDEIHSIFEEFVHYFNDHFPELQKKVKIHLMLQHSTGKCPNLLSRRLLVCYENTGHVLVTYCYRSKVITIATCSHSCRSCLPSFLHHPSLPSFKFKVFSFICRTVHIKFYALRNLLPEAIYCCLHTCCVSVVLSEMCYVCTPTFLAKLANMGQF